MTEERKARHNWTGPRLPRGPKYQRALELSIRVAHCGGCGSPRAVIDLAGMRGGLAGRFPICEECWRHFNPVDPLEVDQDAISA